MAPTRKQLALIHVARKQLGLSDERYRGILRTVADVDSSKDLDRQGFELVMQTMAALGFRSDFTRGFYGRRRGMATPAQVSDIRRLWGIYAANPDDGRALDKWLERTFKVSALRFATGEQADAAIRALRAMIGRSRRQTRPAGPPPEEIARWRHGVIAPALKHPPRSRARVEAIAAASRTERDHPTGRRGPLAESTVRRWMLAFEQHGMAGLEPKRGGSDAPPDAV